MQFMDIWQVLAGVAFFLLGIHFMEDALQQLAGRQFKLFLKKQTASKTRAIAGGTIVTAVLQSSSVVNLMVLAFVGAGIFTVRNALAVILGSNLGTTFTGWIIVLAGFSLKIEAMALPLAGLAGLGYSLLPPHGKWHRICRFFLGFSFLFIGLGYMKTGMEAFVAEVNLQQFAQAPLIIFLLAGFIITAMVQSSSATMAICLTALHAGALTFDDSIAVILGSELGTTVKLFIASIKGAQAKRKVALGNFGFNILSVILVLVFLPWLSPMVRSLPGMTDPLIALVFFQSLVNFLGILLFAPWLDRIAHFLDLRIRKEEEETLYIHKADLKAPQAALIALEKETRCFLFASLHYLGDVFSVKPGSFENGCQHKKTNGMSSAEKYEHLKFLYGEIHGYCSSMQQLLNSTADTEKLDRLLAAVRNTMYAAKSIKDAVPDLIQLENSSNDVKYEFYTRTRADVQEFCTEFANLLHDPAAPDTGLLLHLYRQIAGNYSGTLRNLYTTGTASRLNETEISTLLNFNREITTAFKSLVFAAREYLLDREQSKNLGEMPGFIH